MNARGRGGLAQLERSRDALTKEWVIRLIERASLDDIKRLPIESLAEAVPDMVSELLRAAGSEPVELSEAGREESVRFARLRQGSVDSVAGLVSDVASLEVVLVRALGSQLAASDPEGFAACVQGLVDATAAVQAAALEEVVGARSAELEAQANTDPLTGLYNVRYLRRQMAYLIEVTKRYGHPFALMLLDVDGLKRVNDAHGHGAGDRVLIQLAGSIKRTIRAVDTAARLGGDEFCVLAPFQSADKGVVLAQRLARTANDQIDAPRGSGVSVSIGVASCPEHGEDAEVLVENADRAMYHAKAASQRVATADLEEQGEPGARAPQA